MSPRLVRMLLASSYFDQGIMERTTWSILPRKASRKTGKLDSSRHKGTVLRRCCPNFLYFSRMSAWDYSCWVTFSDGLLSSYLLMLIFSFCGGFSLYSGVRLARRGLDAYYLSALTNCASERFSYFLSSNPSTAEPTSFLYYCSDCFNYSLSYCSIVSTLLCYY